jgi:hypothetical protein
MQPDTEARGSKLRKRVRRGTNAARHSPAIPFPNSFDIQTVAFVAANSNSEF